MAQVSSGSFNTSSCEGRYLTFNWSVHSTNTGENYKRIYWSLVGAGVSGYVTCGNFKVVIEGETVYSSANRFDVWNGLVVASGYKDIYHNNDGSKTFSASAEAGIYTYAVNCYGSGSWELPTISKYAQPQMEKSGGGAILALSYIGGEKAVANYNIMGVAKAALEASVRYAAMDMGAQKVRVNAISAGPIKTLAASGIGDFRKILRWNELNAPLQANVTQEQVGRATLALLSDLGEAITGEVIHVDNGYNIISMINLANAKASGEVLCEF